MDLYADPITVNCKKVVSGLQMMGVPYQLKRVDYFKGEHKQSPYVDMNANASLPAMMDDDFALWESNAILQYAADKHGKTSFYPTDQRRRADVNRWMFWEGAHWFPSCYVYLVENCVKPLLGGKPDPAIIEKEAPNFHKLAGILDDRLSHSDWLCGSAPTIADISVASAMHLWGWQQLPLDQHRPLKRWLVEKVEGLPAWKNTMVYEGFTLQKPN